MTWSLNALHLAAGYQAAQLCGPSQIQAPRLKGHTEVDSLNLSALSRKYERSNFFFWVLITRDAEVFSLVFRETIATRTNVLPTSSQITSVDKEN